MAALRSFYLVAWLASLIAALPTSHSSASRYPQAKHVIPLYRTEPNGIGDFNAEITIGGQTLRGIVDTGSSDTWFMQPEVQCLNTSTLKPISSKKCGFTGPPLKPSSSFKPLDTFSNGTYGSAQSYVADDGYDRVEFGGIKIPKLKIGRAIQFAGQAPDAGASGFIGLAYPALTSTYSTADCNDTQSTANCKKQIYPPIMTTIFADKLAPPVFAFAISRSAPEAGVLTIGGIPDLQEPRINITSQSSEASVPIEKVDPIPENSFYALSIDGLQYSGAAAGAGKGQFVVDSGTIELTVGTEEAKAVNALFDPPAVDTEGTYILPCNATPPDFGIELGGKVFGINPRDMILDVGLPDSMCSSAVQANLATKGPKILGSIFLRNVFAVFDVGKSQMTFASRMYYQE